MGLRYGGKLVTDYSAMQGPAPDGFHVPSDDEWVALCEILTTTFSMAGNATTMGTYLKLPSAGRRVYSSSDVSSQGTYGYYWYSTAYSEAAGFAYGLTFSSLSFDSQNGYPRTNGLSVRCFKDSPAIPDSNWTTLYQGTGSAGVFRNSSLGLISVSGDGTTWITIQDKNLGATTVYNQGDTLSEANCGKYYQWGNNYGFARTGTVTTSSTQVDASNYGPGNYYNSSTFIIGSGDWSSVQNDNLRGGTTGVQQKPTKIVKRYYGGKMADNYSAMKGPCPERFHVPSKDEWVAVKTVWTSLGGGNNDGTNFGIALKLPLTGRRSYSSASISYQGTYGYYWSSTDYSTGSAYCLFFGSSSLSPQYGYERASGFTVRCFKDSPAIPTSSWTKLYGTSIESGGIFWSSTDGLISLSSDGDTWITIQDKNLGATTVWNNGDTLSEANCGKYYQWGNNYGFPFTDVLPSGYIRLDYVSSPSSSRIDTGIIGDETTVITANFRISNLENMYVYACQSSNNTRGITAYITPTTGNWRYGTQTYSIGIFEANVWYNTVQDANGVSVNGTLYPYGTVSEFTTPYTIIFGTSHSSTGGFGTAYFHGDLGEFKIEKGGEVVANYIPCKRVSDDTCGFYDTVSETFKVSATANSYVGNGNAAISDTQVDASNYGPGNYYESSTFIIGNSDWSSVQNDNLWGGETGIQQKPVEVIKVYKGNIQIRPVVHAQFTDWESSVWDYVSQAFSDAGYDIGTAIANLFGGDFAQSIETATGTYLSDWEFSPIMPFYPITTSWYGLQISNGGDMIDKHLVPESPGYTQSICIIRDNDNLSDAEYIVGTYDSSDDGFDYQLSSLASNFSGKDTVCMFIFLM